MREEKSRDGNEWSNNRIALHQGLLASGKLNQYDAAFSRCVQINKEFLYG
jgi:hypothetical protein